MLSLHNGYLGIPTHCTIEVVGCETELAIPKLVCFVSFYKRIVAFDALLQKVLLAIKDLDIFGVRVMLGGSIWIVLQRQFSRLHNCTKSCRSIKCRNSLSSTRTSFRQGSLWCEFQFDLSSQVHLLESLILSNVTCNHLLDLLRLQKLAQA